MAKRAQITVFILIGIVLVLILSVFMYMRSTTDKTSITAVDLTTTDSDQVKQFVTVCLEDTMEMAADYVAFQGGYCSPPKKSYITGLSIAAPYYVDGEGVKTPTADDVKAELELCVEAFIEGCFNEFESFTSKGMQVNSVGLPVAKVTMARDAISVRLEHPLIVKDGEKEYRIDDYKAKIDHPIMMMHEKGSEVADAINADKEIVPTAEIIRLLNDDSLTFKTGFDEKTLFFSMQHGLDTSEETAFNFAVDYS